MSNAARLALTHLLAPLALALASAGAAVANPTATEFSGNPTCAFFDADNIAFRIDPAPEGVTHHTDGLLNVTINHYETDAGWFLDWNKNAPSHCKVNGVLVKGGNGGFYYAYSPALNGDTGLHAIIAGGSGKFAAVSHVDFCYSCEQAWQGCTPGYWKNHSAAWAATGYQPGDSLQSVFGADALAGTLANGLGFTGGPGVDGAKRILLRASVAALLSAAHPDVAYPYTEAEVLTGVAAALASGNRATMLAYAADLDQANNLGCPLN
jgi:hypothetical protein